MCPRFHKPGPLLHRLHLCAPESSGHNHSPIGKDIFEDRAHSLPHLGLDFPGGGCNFAKIDVKTTTVRQSCGQDVANVRQDCGKFVAKLFRKCGEIVARVSAKSSYLALKASLRIGVSGTPKQNVHRPKKMLRGSCLEATSSDIIMHLGEASHARR